MFKLNISSKKNFQVEINPLTSKTKSALECETNLSTAEIESMDEIKACQYLYNIRRKREVCFTGFPKAQKNHLIKLANENKLKVVNSITVKLDFLVIGNSAGPSKLKKAESQDTQILTYNEFIDLFKSC